MWCESAESKENWQHQIGYMWFEMAQQVTQVYGTSLLTILVTSLIDKFTHISWTLALQLSQLRMESGSAPQSSWQIVHTMVSSQASPRSLLNAVQQHCPSLPLNLLYYLPGSCSHMHPSYQVDNLCLPNLTSQTHVHVHTETLQAPLGPTVLRLFWATHTRLNI